MVMARTASATEGPRSFRNLSCAAAFVGCAGWDLRRTGRRRNGSMRKLILAASLVASLGAMSVADVAGAHPYHHYHYYHHHYRGGCGYQKHRSGAIGAVAGAVGGG